MKATAEFGIHRAGAVALLVLAVAGCMPGGSDRMVLRKAPIVRAELVRTVDATGKVTPRNTSSGVPVGAQVTGKIIKILVDYNSTVTNGQVVALVDPQVYRANYDAACAELEVAESNVMLREAEIRSAEAALSFAKKTYERNSKLVEKGHVAEIEFDQALEARDTKAAALACAKAALVSAKASVSRARAAAKQAKANLDYCSIRSPVNGVVIDRKVQEGETVVSTYNTTPIVTIAEDLKTVWIEATVPEADVGGIRVGQEVSFSADAYPRTFAGRVKQVRRASRSTNNVVTFPVIVEAENPGEMLFPGMTVTLSISTGRAENAVVVSVAALCFTPKPEDCVRAAPPDAASVVWLANGQGKLEPVAVKTGISDDSFIALENADALVGRIAAVGYHSQSAERDDALVNPFQPKPKKSGTAGR